MNDLATQLGAGAAVLALLVTGFWYLLKSKQDRSECSLVQKNFTEALTRGQKKFDELFDAVAGKEGMRVEIAELRTSLNNWMQQNGKK